MKTVIIYTDGACSITSIEVAVGQEVKAGDTVVVLEAMKMQNNIEAEKSSLIHGYIKEQSLQDDTQA